VMHMSTVLWLINMVAKRHHPCGGLVIKT